GCGICRFKHLAAIYFVWYWPAYGFGSCCGAA
ncbi:multidrug resistance norM domain protein, partial [Vibrio parahaemolyticus EKP-008]